MATEAEILATEAGRRAKIAAARKTQVENIRLASASSAPKESPASKKKRRAIADEIAGDDESPLAIYATARKALEWALRDLMQDDSVTSERRRTEIAKISSALASNKPLERMRQIELRLKQEDAEINRVNAGVPLVNAQQIRPAGMVSRRGRPPRQSLR